jgi:hypothetical protein
VVDVFGAGEDVSPIFYQLKDRLKTQLLQDKIYVTKQQSKEEFLSFEEFFIEVGLEDVPSDPSTYPKLASQFSEKFEFVRRRIGYETTLLRRHQGRIVWERRISGIKLRSEWEDGLPADVRLIAADQIDDIAALLGSVEQFAIVGGYEYQFHVLRTLKPRRLVKDVSPLVPLEGWTYFSQAGETLSIDEFINEFTTAVFINCIVMLDEGYLLQELRINVGSDGSMQLGQRDHAQGLFIVPARIPQKELQMEIIRCLRGLLDAYSRDDVDVLALLQAKAKHGYLVNRALLRKALRENGARP